MPDSISSIIFPDFDPQGLLEAEGRPAKWSWNGLRNEPSTSRYHHFWGNLNTNPFLTLPRARNRSKYRLRSDPCWTQFFRLFRYRGAGRPSASRRPRGQNPKKQKKSPKNSAGNGVRHGNALTRFIKIQFFKIRRKSFEFTQKWPRTPPRTPPRPSRTIPKNFDFLTPGPPGGRRPTGKYDDQHDHKNGYN